MRPFDYRSSNPGSRWNRVAAATVLAMTVATGAVTLVHAQSAGEITQSDALVNIVGKGEDIRAAGASVSIGGDASEVSAAGAVVSVHANVKGDVRAAGAQVDIDGSVGRDARVAGAVVEVGGNIGRNAFLTGAVVRLDAKVTGNVRVAAATIEIGPGAEIGRQLSAAGAMVTFQGKTGSARLAGAVVTFNGQASGTVTIDANRIMIGSTAVISGDLVIRSHNDPVVAEGATISGQLRREAPREWWQLPDWLWPVLVAGAIAAGTLLGGLILLLIGRRGFEEALSQSTLRPFTSGLIGLATIILLPIAALILMVTVIGLSFGLALFLVLPFLIVSGHAVMAACVAAWLLERRQGERSIGWLIVLLIVGGVILGLVWLVPWAGPVIVLLAILVGVGAFVRTVAARMRRPRPIPAV